MFFVLCTVMGGVFLGDDQITMTSPIYFHSLNPDDKSRHLSERFSSPTRSLMNSYFLIYFCSNSVFSKRKTKLFLGFNVYDKTLGIVMKFVL